MIPLDLSLFAKEPISMNPHCRSFMDTIENIFGVQVLDQVTWCLQADTIQPNRGTQATKLVKMFFRNDNIKKEFKY